jgi:hypothetical protein
MKTIRGASAVPHSPALSHTARGRLRRGGSATGSLVAVLLLAWFSMLSLTPLAYAADDAVSQARRLFDRYVALGAAYDVAVADLYADSAFIKNTRRYPDGQSRSMTMPALTYKTLIRQIMPQAKAAGDLSTYSDVKFIPDGARVRIEATRYSELKKYSSPFVLVVGPSDSGAWQILEEVGESRP